MKYYKDNRDSIFMLWKGTLYMRMANHNEWTTISDKECMIEDHKILFDFKEITYEEALLEMI